jgi:hypothetical protein
MGAGPSSGARVSSTAPRFYCRDGAWVTTASACGTFHGGLEREVGAGGPN